MNATSYDPTPALNVRRRMRVAGSAVGGLGSALFYTYLALRTGHVAANPANALSAGALAGVLGACAGWVLAECVRWLLPGQWRLARELAASRARVKRTLRAARIYRRHRGTNGGEPNAPPVMPFDTYVKLTRELPLPSAAQRAAFAEYVAHAHSWYKHLGLFPPGTPFYFFLDKYAAHDYLPGADAGKRFVERAQGGFHYSALPTHEHLSRFGHLAYSAHVGTRVFLDQGRASAVPRDRIAAVADDRGTLWMPPEEILLAGQVRLTAVIHRAAASLGFWEDRARRDTNPAPSWPEESGGDATLARILERCREMSAPDFVCAMPTAPAELDRTDSEAAWHLQRNDPVLRALFEPERRRQMRAIVAAIDHVCELLGTRRTRGSLRHAKAVRT